MSILKSDKLYFRCISHCFTFAANTKTVEQRNQPLLTKKTCKKEDLVNSGNGNRQTVGQKAEEKSKVVGKDNKHDCRVAVTRPTAAGLEISSQTKSRKKRNRRNRDRTASAVTLDFRSTSCTVCEDISDDCPENRVMETKSFHAPDKVTSSCKGKSAAGGGKKLSHVKSDHLQDTFSCRSSAGDNSRDGRTRQVLKEHTKPASATTVCPGNRLLRRLSCIFAKQNGVIRTDWYNSC